MSTIFAENRLEWRIFSEKDLPKLKNTYIVLLLHSPIAQSVEQRTVNPWVVGSSPTRGATSSFRGLQEEKSASLRCRVFFISARKRHIKQKSADPKIDAFCCQNRLLPSLLLQLTLSNLIQLSRQHRNDGAAVDELTRKHKEIQVKLTTAYRQLVVRDTAQQFNASMRLLASSACSMTLRKFSLPSSPVEICLRYCARFCCSFLSSPW